MFDFSIVSQWFDSLLRETLGLGDFWSILIECVIVGLLILVAYALIAIALIFMERKVCAYFQCRLGPMRVGPWGTLQVFADVLKMLIKEIFFVDRADKLLYGVAPLLVIIGSVGAFGFLPWNKGAGVLDFNVGIFLLTAISSIGIVGIFLAGWASNNKYSVVSAMRGAVQMISYEISLCLCLISARCRSAVLLRHRQDHGTGSSSRGIFPPSSPSSPSSSQATQRPTADRLTWQRQRAS